MKIWCFSFGFGLLFRLKKTFKGADLDKTMNPEDNQQINCCMKIIVGCSPNVVLKLQYFFWHFNSCLMLVGFLYPAVVVAIILVDPLFINNLLCNYSPKQSVLHLFFPSSLRLKRESLNSSNTVTGIWNGGDFTLLCCSYRRMSSTRSVVMMFGFKGFVSLLMSLPRL